MQMRCKRGSVKKCESGCSFSDASKEDKTTDGKERCMRDSLTRRIRESVHVINDDCGTSWEPRTNDPVMTQQ